MSSANRLLTVQEASQMMLDEIKQGGENICNSVFPEGSEAERLEMSKRRLDNRQQLVDAVTLQVANGMSRQMFYGI